MAQITSGSLTIVDVTDGAPGLNNTTVFLYRRAASAPDKPTGNLTYTFSTASITGALEGWVQSINELTGSNPIWMIAAVASSNGETDVIESSEWVGPIKMAQNGQDGRPGTNGLNQATIFIYKRDDSATAPSSTTYTFSTGDFVTPSGWSKTIPTTPKGKPCWVTSAVAIGAEATVVLNWAAPSILVEDGINGKSPTVTATGNGVKIVDGDGNETYVTNGVDGSSYYTFIRYSKNANGSGYVATPTSETIYIGVYAGTASSPPAYNDSGWTWSRYVGTDGQPGSQGVSVTNTKELYYLKTNSIDPARITNADQIHTTDDVNQWTSIVPTYIGSGKYYTCIETNLSNETVVWSAPVENKGLTDANVNAMQAVEIAKGVRQHFFWLPGDVSSNVPSGAYVAEENEETFKAGPTKGNILTRSDGIWIRNGVDKLATLQGSGLTFLVPAGTYKGQKSVSLSGAGLTFYNIGSSNSAAATLASDGLQITNGSIILGTTGGTDAGNVTLSNKNFQRSINNVSHNDLRLAIGSKFGVTADGTLYAANADISGKITVGSGSNVYTTDDVNPLEIGGRNILLRSEQMPTSSEFWRANTNAQINNGEAVLHGTTENWSACLETNMFDISIYDGITDYIVSFDYKSTEPVNLYPNIAASATKTHARTKYVVWQAQFTLPSTNGVWKRYALSPRTISVADLTYGSGDCNYGYLQFYNRTANGADLYLRHIKLEKGNKATDWSPAPEDVDIGIADAAKTATNYITNIDSNKGITVKPADSSGNDYLQMNSSDIRFVRNNVDVMNLSDSVFRMGQASSGHSTVKSDGLHIWTGAESTASNEVASFGSTARIGKSEAQRLELTASELAMYTSDNQKRVSVTSSSGVVVGRSDKGHTVVNDTGLVIYDTNNKKAAETSTAGLTLYSSGSKRAAVTSSGLNIFSSDGSSSIASFTSGSAAANVVFIRDFEISVTDGNCIIDDLANAPSGSTIIATFSRYNYDTKTTSYLPLTFKKGTSDTIYAINYDGNKHFTGGGSDYRVTLVRLKYYKSTTSPRLLLGETTLNKAIAVGRTLNNINSPDIFSVGWNGEVHMSGSIKNVAGSSIQVNDDTGSYIGYSYTNGIRSGCIAYDAKGNDPYHAFWINGAGSFYVYGDSVNASKDFYCPTLYIDGYEHVGRKDIKSKCTITKSSGSSTCTIESAYLTGRTVSMSLLFKATAAITAGADLFKGTLADNYRPFMIHTGTGYYGAGVITITISSVGSVTVRTSGAIGSGGEVRVCITYMI